jgi:Uma2 family endonuclease
MPAALRLTVDDNLAAEAEAIAMASVEPQHDVVRAALSVEIGLALRGRPCLSFSADQRVLLAETSLSCYPDLVVVCGSPEFAVPRPRSLTNPTALLEVLSPSTEIWDRNGKFAHTQRHDSLRVYVLVDPASLRIEWFTRGEAGRWEYQSVAGEGLCRIDALDAGE